ncbi:hypothetical protein KBC04_02655 [Candidatus Babeliales bacterium]|nr:hypothetical protein [Candidatus Babeliales bacterium]MBP9844047.1 hypothetical protein [Candidatus Babeliales bacterium]
MKKIFSIAIAFLCFLHCSIIFADKNNDAFELHANSWVFIAQHESNCREYVNTVDGMRGFVTYYDTKQNVTSYNALGEYLDSFDLYYGSSSDAEYFSNSPLQISSSEQPGLRQSSLQRQRTSTSSAAGNNTHPQFEEFKKSSENSVANMKSSCLKADPVNQRRVVDALYTCGSITAEQAFLHYQKIDADIKELEAQKVALQIQKDEEKNKKRLIRKQNKQPSRTKKIIQDIFGYVFKKKVATQKIIPKKTQSQTTTNSEAPPVATTPTTTSSTEKKVLAPASQTTPLINYLEIQSLQDQNNTILENSQNSLQQNSPFQKVMENRSKAFNESVKRPTPVVKKYSLNSQTAGYLQSKNIDISQFQKVDGLEIQHLLTDELLDVLDTVANLSLYKNLEIYQHSLAHYCATLASLSQQSNQEGFLPQTMQGANSCHGITHYLEGTLTGAAEQFQTAMQYFNTVLDYGQAVACGLATGALDAMPAALVIGVGTAMLPPAAAGLALEATLIATAIYIGDLCGQATMKSAGFGNSLKNQEWDKVKEYLNKSYEYVTKLENIENGAHFIGALAGSYGASSALQNLMSLQPVIGIIKQPSGSYSGSASLLDEQTYIKKMIESRELLQSPDFQNFKMHFKRILGVDIFTITPQRNLVGTGWNPKPVPAITGTEPGLINSAGQSLFAKIFLQSGSDVVKNGVNSIYQVSKETLSKNFAKTETGKNVIKAMNQKYEELMFKNTANQYDKLMNNQALPEVIDLFNTCQELSIVPQYITDDIQRLQTLFKDKYLGLEEFSGENKYLTMQMRHIFYPSLQVKLDVTNQTIKEIHLNGFHHDELEALEKSGLCKFINRVEGKDCFMADVDFGNGIICKGKTFFSPSWSRKETAQIIFEASQNIIDDLTEVGDPNKELLCQAPNGLFIEMIINLKNMIKSAYPSSKNFEK